MKGSLLDAAKALPLHEQIQLAEALWENIAAAGYEPQLTDAQAIELDRRVAEHLRNPGTATPWNQIRTEIERKHAPQG